MTAQSILAINGKDRIQSDTIEPPAYFPDLNIDQIVNAITVNKERYNLKPFFYSPLQDVETIRFRHEVMRDLQDATLMATIKTFAEKMIVVHRYLGLIEKLEFNYHKKGWFLEAALAYCQAVAELQANLASASLESRGLSAFRQYLTGYIQSPEFQTLHTEAQEVKGRLAGVKYCVIINPGKFSVRKYQGEPDYSIEVEKTFEKFKQGAVEDYLVKLNQTSGMNHIEAQILNFAARLYPDEFAALDKFCERQGSFIDETIFTFEREIQFYVAYLDFIAPFKHRGLSFCYPHVSPTSREIHALASFDLALAYNASFNNQKVVSNDFSLKDPERIIVVSGPNQGGKTTFARMFGQLHYLASLGCPVPGQEAQLDLFDQIFVHFERQEDIRNLHGKLQDDLVRIHTILANATPKSILIVNEMFASTTLKDAIFLSKEIMTRVMALDILCVWVTFIDELSTLSEKTISMVSTVVPDHPAQRTFKILRKPADGLAYAKSIAEKHRLTYEDVKERIQA